MKKNFLLIDDDEDDQEIFLTVLEKLDIEFDCRVSQDGVEGLKILSDAHYIPDYIFVDINMPKMSGVEVLRKIKELEHLRNSYIVMYSTSQQENVIRECKDLGANDYITKPPGINLLTDALRNIITGQLNV